MEEEPNATLEVSSARDFSVDCSGNNDCSCSSHKDSDVIMPICFLVKEQAKSVIELQEVKKRLIRVENVQDDVVSAIIEIRNYLSDSKSYSAFSSATTPNTSHPNRNSIPPFPKLTPLNNNTDVPSGLDRSVISSSKTVNSKECESIYNNEIVCGNPSQECSTKHFDLAKSKDSALESDKQDSGLDSDCREHHDPPSLKASLNRDNNDELLQLLDEIGHRSVILQKQLAVAEEATTLVELSEMPALQTGQSDPTMPPLQGDLVGTSQSECTGVSNHSSNVHSKHSFFDNSMRPPEKKVPTVVNIRQNRLAGLSESDFLDRMPKKSAVHGIDSAVVSSILKKTSVVDLQRMTLTYFVDNARLNTKLREMEQSFSSKRQESEKVESALKEEARLLMMENRELRIQLEEQRLESNSIKSRLAMLERVVQSVSNENQELNWQLSESLNLQPLTKRASFPANAVGLSSSDGASRLNRRSSLPTPGEMNIHCVKSKLLSNNSSFLDVTIEDPREFVVEPTQDGFAFHDPVHSSTPMMPFQNQKNTFKTSGPSDNFPKNFHSVKKCLNIKSRGLSRVDIPGSSKTETLPPDSKFPFNTILKKLKANSDYRLSKSASVRASELSGPNSEGLSKCVAGSKPKVLLKENESASDQKATQDTSVAQQRRKSGDIHQRIQNILDRIVAESEETS